MAEEFIGSGWAFSTRLPRGDSMEDERRTVVRRDFPEDTRGVRTDGTGRIALVSGEREIEEAIGLILETAYGERPMRPEFGCGIHDFIFAPADDATAARLAFEVRASLQRWEPRIDVVDVQVTIDQRDRGFMYIDIRYTIRGSNDPRNLVFPFYVIPEHEEV